MRIFVDTNVLFPFSVMDFFLALTEDAVHEVIWTEVLLGEWERVIVRENRRSPRSAAAVTAAIRTFFPENQVKEEAYLHLVPHMHGKDVDDRYHAAAAVAAGAEALVTWNVQDFPPLPLAGHGVRVLDPDTYLCELHEMMPDEIRETFLRMVAEKSSPPISPEDMAGRLARAGVSRFVKEMRERV
ncbi:PIN domain-containing protein [Streptomyces calidiresistens]|uniref:PIN domain-containing protein n=1 Tax=Streptomyces calidiresistens TaxID=1485586 RepID=A0A7W3XX37_9ACTN|nr:PIN domain-containing protein [Streptomyces calidiresistens]MBB0230513.1 PIN domain-containing protein [Streptomyces calidiresistens]